MGYQDRDVDLNYDDRSIKHTHTTAATAEVINLPAVFPPGAILDICGIDTWIAVGGAGAAGKALAEAGGIMRPAGVPLRVQLENIDGGESTFYLDAATGGTVSIWQVI